MRHRRLDDLGREVEHPLALRDARVVDQHVDAAEVFRRAARERGQSVEVGEVDGPGARLRRVDLALFEHVVELVGAPRADPDGRAPLRESDRERGADPRRTARHQHVLAAQVVRHARRP